MEEMKDVRRIDTAEKGRRGLPREKRFVITAPGTDEGWPRP